MPNLADLDNAWQQAEEPESTYTDVPDGKYNVRVDDVELRTSENTGDRFLNWQLKILDGEFSGSMLFRKHWLESPENLGWLKKDLRSCGMVLEKLSDLPRRMVELQNCKLKVQKKTTRKEDKEYVNIYFNGRLEKPSPGNDPLLQGKESKGGSGDDDDLPF